MLNQKLLRENDTKKKVQGLLSSYGIFVIFLLMVLLMSILSGGRFLRPGNILTVLKQVSINGILSLGMMTVLVTGGIDLSVGSILALAGVVATSYAHPEPYYPIWMVIGLGLLVGLVCGLVNGVVVAYLNVPAFIATLGMMSVARGLTMLYVDGKPVNGLSPAYRFIGRESVLGIPAMVWILLIFIVVTFIIMHRSVLGRYIFAIGGNEMAASASGINTRKIKLFAYAFCGICCGMAGMLLASRTNAAAPGAGSGYELDAIASAVIGGVSTSGGKGRVLGACVGFLILGIISNGLDLLNVSSYIQQVIKGLIIVAAVFFDQRSNARSA